MYLLGVLDPLPAGRVEVGPRVDLDTHTADTQHMTEGLKRVLSTFQSQGCQDSAAVTFSTSSLGVATRDVSSTRIDTA